MLALPLVLAGCTEPPSQGMVVEHKYQEAWVQIIPGTPPICSGSPPVCTAGMPQQTIYWPESWALRLDDRHGNVGDHDVDESEYDRCRDGENYPQCARTR